MYPADCIEKKVSVHFCMVDCDLGFTLGGGGGLYMFDPAAYLRGGLGTLSRSCHAALSGKAISRALPIRGAQQKSSSDGSQWIHVGRDLERINHNMKHVQVNGVSSTLHI